MRRAESSDKFARLLDDSLAPMIGREDSNVEKRKTDLMIDDNGLILGLQLRQQGFFVVTKMSIGCHVASRCAATRAT